MLQEVVVVVVVTVVVILSCCRDYKGRCCEVRESFNVEVGVRQGCIMSPWLFNIYMDM